jgi:hypothetical protein
MAVQGGVPGLKYISVLNEDEQLPRGPHNPTHSMPYGSGFPEMPRPVIQIHESFGRLPLADVEVLGRSIWLVSERARELFLKLDGSAFDFLKVTINAGIGSENEEGPSYWIVDTIRVLDALSPDHARPDVMPSGFKRSMPKSFDDAIFRSSVVGDAQIFRLLNTSYVYCTAAFAKAIFQHGLTGLRCDLAGHIND